MVGTLALAAILLSTGPRITLADTGSTNAVTGAVSGPAIDAIRLATTPGPYTFVPVNYPNDTFTQLLGINNTGIIAGYHGSGQDAQHPNKGFTLNAATPTAFTAENYPSSAQTQVVGINALGWTDGFYVDTAGTTHGFLSFNGGFYPVDVPGTTFNQLLGINVKGEQAGYYQYGANNTFEAFVHQSNHALQLLPTGNAQATGINDSDAVSGFYLDSTGNSHGYLLPLGSFPPKIINYPNAMATQLLGLNNKGQAVGSYTDSGGATHGFLYNSTTGIFQSVDIPGAGSTIVNGINDFGWIVGFYTPAGQDPANVAIGFIGKPTTTTSVVSSANPTSLHLPVTFTTTVRANPTTSVVVPTGTVKLYDGTTPLTTGTLANGSFAFTSSSLGIGPHTITAVYSGDATYATSTSSPLVETVADAVAVLAGQNGYNVTGMTYLAADLPGGQTQVLEQVNGLAPNSTHPTHIHQGTTCAANGPILYLFPNLVANAQGVASNPTSINTTTIPASGWYVNIHLGPTLGGTGATAISCGVVNLLRNRAQSSTTLSSSANGTHVQQTANVTFSVALNPSAATGQVQLYDTYNNGTVTTTTLLTTGSLSNGAFTYAKSAWGAGGHSVVAVYLGDGNDTGSVSAPVTFSVS
jgi:hypothetical protein